MHIERHIRKYVALAVERVDILHGQQRLRLGGASTWLGSDAGRTRSDINLLHLLARSGVLHRTVDKHFALVHHRDSIRDLKDAVDVMLNQKHRQVGRDALDDVADTLPLGGRQPRKGFIEQEKTRLCGEREAHV